MKFLLDSCVWGGVLEELTAMHFDAVWAGHWERDPGDEEILQRAVAESRVLVTLDKDFGYLAVALDQPHPAMIRLVGISARQQATMIAHVARSHHLDLANCALITVEPGRIRVRSRSADHSPASDYG